MLLYDRGIYSVKFRDFKNFVGHFASVIRQYSLRMQSETKIDLNFLSV